MNCNHEKANVGDRFCPECGDAVVWVPKVHTEDPDCPPDRVYSGGAKAPKTFEICDACGAKVEETHVLGIGNVCKRCYDGCDQ